MFERGLKQHFGAPVESTDEFNNAAFAHLLTITPLRVLFAVTHDMTSSATN